MNGAAKKGITMIKYEAWVCQYSNEAFDRAQNLALALTQDDRDAGREAPPAGYSTVRWLEADAAVKSAQTY